MDGVERHHIGLTTDVEDTEDWLRRTGYGFDCSSSHGFDFVPLRREGHPTVIARVGQVLVWDGHTLTVEET